MGSVVSIERIDLTLGGGVSVNQSDLSLGQDDAQCVPFATFYHGATANNSSDDYTGNMGEVEIYDNAGTAAVRVARTATLDPLVYTIYVVEFGPDINVYRGTVDTVSGTGTSPSIGGTVVMAKTFILFYYKRESGDVDAHDSAAVSCQLASTTTIDLTRTASADGTFSGWWYVVEDTASNWDVQRGSFQLTTADTSANSSAFTAVTMAKTFVITCQRNDQVDDDVNSGCCYVDLNSTTTVRARRTVTGTTTIDVEFQVIEFDSGGSDNVYRGDLAFSSSSIQETASHTAVDPDFSITTSPMKHHRIGSGTGTGSSDNSASAIKMILNATDNGIVADRNNFGADASNCSWETVEFTQASTSKTASGTPSITKPTSTGVSEIEKIASGTPSITNITSAGVSEIEKIASGTPSITGPITSAGSADAFKAASGSPSILGPTSSGAATIEKIASGTPSITQITSAGNADVPLSASGTPSINSVTSAGTSEIEKIASGSPSILNITSAGVADLKWVASGSPSIGIPISSGTSVIEKIAGGGAILQSIATAGVAEVEKIASGTPSITQVTSAGTGVVEKQASGTPSIDPITSAGVAEIEKQASGGPSITPVTSAGAVTFERDASGAPSILKPTSAGTAIAGGTFIASGSPLINPITSVGNADNPFNASGAPSIAIPTSTGTAIVERQASGSPSIGIPTSTGVAEIEKLSSGAPSITQVTSAGAVTFERAASGTPSITKPTSAGSADSGTSTAVDTDLRVTFDTPPGRPQVGADLQKFRMWLRRDAANTGSGIPTVDVYLYENGAQVGSALLTGVNITSDSGQLVEATWDAGDLTNGSGTGVECFIDATVGGAGGGARTVEYGAVEWCAQVTLPEVTAVGTPSITAITSAGTAGLGKFTSGAPVLNPVTSAGWLQLNMIEEYPWRIVYVELEDRTRDVVAEDRTSVVTEDRVTLVVLEDRTVAVILEDRATEVATEDRLIEVPSEP